MTKKFRLKQKNSKKFKIKKVDLDFILNDLEKSENEETLTFDEFFIQTQISIQEKFSKNKNNFRKKFFKKFKNL